MSSWGDAAWQSRAFSAEGYSRNLRQLQIQVQRWIDQCTCPACHITWQHYWSQPWILQHFGSDAGPITCSQCGVVSVSGQHVGVRQRYQPDPIQRPKPQTFWRKVKALSEVPEPIMHELAVPSVDMPPMRGDDFRARSRSGAQVSDSQADSPEL